MKVRFILSLLVTLLVAGSVLANGDKVSGKGVVLKGEIGTSTGRSVIPIIPIKAFVVDNNIIYIQYDAPLGTVQVLVNGQVEETAEVTTVGQETIFSIADLTPGVYKLELKTPKGGYVYGEFEVEEEDIP